MRDAEWRIKHGMRNGVKNSYLLIITKIHFTNSNNDMLIKTKKTKIHLLIAMTTNTIQTKQERPA